MKYLRIAAALFLAIKAIPMLLSSPLLGGIILLALTALLPRGEA